MKKHFKKLSIFMSMLILLATGCTHTLEIKNLSTFENMSLSSLERPVSIGIIPTSVDLHGQKLIKGIATELGKASANILLPYFPNSTKEVDITAKIVVKPEYRGSGWNFLINFPGFLIFTPAWNGYVYQVNYDVDVLLTDQKNNNKIDSFQIPVHLNIRHADMNRTWTEISWFEVGSIALISGIIFIQYDDSVSPLVAEKIQIPIGDYIAQEIVARVNNYGEFGAEPPISEQPNIPVIENES